MAPQSIFLLALSSALLLARAHAYCTPDASCWPTDSDWDGLRAKLTATASLRKLNTDDYTAEYSKCRDFGFSSSAAVSLQGTDVCLQHHDCLFEKCDNSGNRGVPNMPEYMLEARTPVDIQEGIRFANQFDIPVSVKNTGHSYQGSSYGRGTLSIWLANLRKFSTVETNWTSTCSGSVAVTPGVLKVGGGETWGDVYPAGADYNVVGGGGLTVGAAGGWLQGVGLSALMRRLGTGIDNVLQFEVVTAAGDLVTADACTNSDLFWALRGGGGGTFGVVVTAYYQLHASTPIVEFVVGASFEGKDRAVRRKWVEFLIPRLLDMDDRWAGYTFVAAGLLFYFQGTQAEAEATFIDAVRTFKSDNAYDDGDFSFGIRTATNYWALRQNDETDPGGYPTHPVSSRLVPREWVAADTSRAVEMLMSLNDLGMESCCHYFLGGKVSQIATDATAVNPAMRRAMFQFNSYPEGADFLRELVPNNAGGGAGFNHHYKLKPDWEVALWGSNVARLKELKTKWDPNSRFNCWHCIGYQEPAPYTGPTGEGGLSAAPLNRLATTLCALTTVTFTFWVGRVV